MSTISRSRGASERIAVHALTSDQLEAAARDRLRVGAGRARRLYRQVVQEGRFVPDAVGLGPRSEAEWNREFEFSLPDVVRIIDGHDADQGTTSKAVLRSPEGLEYECVHIPMGRGRHTLCVSSQIGCKMGCCFCETGRMGLLRNLTASEIVGQVLVARHRLGWPIRNVVFMGMGEALDNFEHLAQALRVFTDPGGLAIAQERLTVCTVGRAEGIRRLAALGLKRLNLSVSLNATRDAQRSRLMPVNRTTPLGELQRALVEFRPRRNFVLGVNYCLLPELNDGRDDARRIAEFCRPLERVLVNLIPYNAGSAPLTRAPTEEEIERFVGWLRQHGVPVRRRVTKGREVMAACGQLGNVELRRKR